MTNFCSKCKGPISQTETVRTRKIYDNEYHYYHMQCVPELPIKDTIIVEGQLKHIKKETDHGTNT
jgi:hypothetical protein